MGIGKFFKKLFKKILVIAPVISLFAGGGTFFSKLGTRLFGFSEAGGLAAGTSGFFKKNILKAVLWGYSLHSALNPKKPPTFSGAGDYADEPVYSWDGGAITAQANIPVQVVYGDWWINNANIIDREITSKKSIDTENAKLVFRELDMNFNGVNMAEDEVDRNIVNMTTIETETYRNLIIGFEIRTGKHVYYENDVDGWQEFEEVSLYTDPYTNVDLVTRWNQEYEETLGLGRLYDGIHNKFVFTPNDDEVYSFMSFEFAKDFLMRMDLSDKKIYFYKPFSMLMNESEELFDFSMYQIGNGTQANETQGFARVLWNSSILWRAIHGSNNIIAKNEFYFHIDNVIDKYTAPSTSTKTNIYSPAVPLQQGIIKPEANGVSSRTMQHAHLFNFFQNASTNLKFMDAVVHFHEGSKEFTLQVLVDDPFNNTTGFTQEANASVFVQNTYEPRVGSNSHTRYIIGLRGYKAEASITVTNVYHGAMSSAWANANLNTFKAGVQDRHFYGLTGFFQASGTSAFALNPVDLQTEMYNLSYLSFRREPGDISNHVIGTNDPDESLVQPFPSRYAHVYRDRIPRVESFAKQPQFINWGQIDPDDLVRVVNKSIGAIVSFTVYKASKSFNPAPYYEYTNFEPFHISYGFFSCICRPWNETDHRFDPFLIEVANFSSFHDVDPNSKTKSTFTRKSPKSTQFNVEEGEVGSAGVETKTFSNFRAVENQMNFGTNIEKLENLGTRNLMFHRPVFITQKQEIKWDHRVDRYLYSASDPATFYNYNNQLFAEAAVYIPSNEYTLVKVDNSWLPIRGWNQRINWYIGEFPIAVLPNGTAESDYYYPRDGGSAGVNTSVWSTLGLYHQSVVYGGDKKWFSRTQDKTGELDSGYVRDRDGQLPYGEPIIINGHIYWAGQNYVFLNVSDSAINNVFDPHYRQKSKVKYVTAGNWGSASSGLDYYNRLRYYNPAPRGTSYLLPNLLGGYYRFKYNSSTLGIHLNNLYGGESDIIYEPVVYNEQFKIH